MTKDEVIAAQLLRTVSDVVVGLAAVETARGTPDATTRVGTALLFVMVRLFPGATDDEMHAMLDEALATR